MTFEEYWAKLKAPVNETVTSKWYFKEGFEAGAQSMLEKIKAQFEKDLRDRLKAPCEGKEI